MRIHGVDIFCAPLILILLFLSPNSYISENSESTFVAFYYFLRERERECFCFRKFGNFFGIGSMYEEFLGREG